MFSEKSLFSFVGVPSAVGEWQCIYVLGWVSRCLLNVPLHGARRHGLLEAGWGVTLVQLSELASLTFHCALQIRETLLSTSQASSHLRGSSHLPYFIETIAMFPLSHAPR